MRGTAIERVIGVEEDFVYDPVFERESMGVWCQDPAAGENPGSRLLDILKPV